MRLELSPYVDVTRVDGLITQIEFGGRRVSFDQDERVWVTRVLERCPSSTIAEAAGAAGVDLEDALDLLQQLYEIGVMQNASDALVPPLAFVKHIDGLSLTYQVRLGEVFATGVRDPESKRVALGRLIEEYHFILANCEHVSPSILNASNARLRMMWCDYMADEYWHGIWIRSGLQAGGLSESDLLRADPLPTTHAVIRHLQWTAITDPLSYAICLGAGEALGMTPERYKHHFDGLINSGLVSEEVIAPFREHALVDMEHEHHSFSAEVFADVGPLTRSQQDGVRRAMLMYHHLLFEQQLQIIRYYLQEDAPIPFTVDQLPRLGQLPLAGPDKPEAVD